MIRTAIPFGYLFIALFLLAGFGFGIVSFIWGCRKHSRGAKWLGGGLVVLVSTIVAADVVFDGNLEWNPQIHNDAETAGTWADYREMLILATNSTFDYHSSTRTVNGTWTRDDWNLYLHGADFAATMRFVQFRGRYRLMTHPPGDPDMWDGDLGLSRK
jgi:hypothetical protein